MPLESVANVLDDATHAQLTRRFQKLEVLQPSDCMALLVAVSLRSNGCIDPPVQLNKELEIASTKALTSKFFQEIRNLGTNSPVYRIIMIYVVHQPGAQCILYNNPPPYLVLDAVIVEFGVSK